MLTHIIVLLSKMMAFKRFGFFAFMHANNVVLDISTHQYRIKTLWEDAKNALSLILNLTHSNGL